MRGWLLLLSLLLCSQAFANSRHGSIEGVVTMPKVPEPFQTLSNGIIVDVSRNGTIIDVTEFFSQPNDVTVYLTPKRKNAIPIKLEVNRSGEFTTERIKAGRYTLEAKTGAEVQSIEIEVMPGREPVLKIEMQRTGVGCLPTPELIVSDLETKIPSKGETDISTRVGLYNGFVKEGEDNFLLQGIPATIMIDTIQIATPRRSNYNK